MKAQLTLFAFLFCVSITRIIAQPPQAISYQAVARDNVGNPLINTPVSLRFSIHDASASGPIVYQETQSVITNSLGLFNVNIGQGLTLSGSFAAIDWGSNSKFMQVEMNTTGGTSYINLGTQQMLSVPYALNAGNGNWEKSGNDIYNSNNGSVGVGTIAPVPSAKLEVSSTSQGFLLPRLSLAERNAILNPVAGLQIWCLDIKRLQVYDGTTWMNVNPSPIVLPGIEICGEIWMKKNLDVATYRNGDSILYVTDPSHWHGTTIGAYCYYNNDSATYASVYGKLYNWYAVNDPRGLAPEGWHIPRNEYGDMYYCMLDSNQTGGDLKETGFDHWVAPNTGATNATGFTALPGGWRDDDGNFFQVGLRGYWWGASQDIIEDTEARAIFLSNATNSFLFNSFNKGYGFSVRCVKD